MNLTEHILWSRSAKRGSVVYTFIKVYCIEHTFIKDVTNSLIFFQRKCFKCKTFFDAECNEFTCCFICITERKSLTYKIIRNGPVGFTDFDHQGLLLEGFDHNAPMASLYTHPYYIAHYERYGLTKEADWIEYQITPPTEAPERMKRLVQIVATRNKIHTVKVKNARELKRRYGYSYFDVLDAAYQKIYNYQPMTPRQKQYYCNMYFPLLNFDFVTMVANENDEIIAVGLGMPSLSEALRKCQGRLFPFGWFHLLRALKAKRMTDFDLLLIGVRPDYQDKGVTALIFNEMTPYFAQYGIKRVETTAILETNHKSLSCFEEFDHIQHKRRRAFTKEL